MTDDELAKLAADIYEGWVKANPRLGELSGEETADWLHAYIEDNREALQKDDDQPTTLGLFLGEVLVRNQGGRWLAGSGHGLAVTLGDRLMSFPTHKVGKQIAGDATDSVAGWYRNTVAMASQSDEPPHK